MKYIVNISFHAESAIAHEVRQIIERVLLPMAEATPDVAEPMLCEILGNPDAGITSFAFQVTTTDLNRVDPWLDGEVAKFIRILTNRYSERLLHFISKMKVLK